MTPNPLADRVDAHLDLARSDLAALVAHASVHGDPARAEAGRLSAEWVAGRFGELGFACEVIVTSDGFPVSPEITIPEDATEIAINGDGEVYAYFKDQVQPQLLGQFSLVTFSNEKGLEAMGSNLYRETEASGQPNVGDPGQDGRGIFRQGYLEDSSVDAVKELTDLIEAQRGYELNAKVITAADQMLSATVQIR